MDHSRASKLLLILFAVAVAVSVVHYVDNYVNYDDYPLPPADATLPAPSAGTIAVAWFVFTASGLLGLWLWRRRRIVAAACALAAYSISGLIGLGHYATPGATGMVWWRQAHVVADILCGIAVLGFALWAAASSRRLSAAPVPQHAA